MTVTVRASILPFSSAGPDDPDKHSGLQVVNGSLASLDDDRLVIHINGQGALLSFKQEAGVGYIFDRTGKSARSNVALTCA